MWQSFAVIGRGSSEITRWKNYITSKIEDLPYYRTGRSNKEVSVFYLYCAAVTRDSRITHSFLCHWQWTGLHRWQRVTDVQSRRRLRSSSSTLIVPVTSRATLGNRTVHFQSLQPGLGTPYQTMPFQRPPLHHLCIDEDVSVFQDFLTLTTCVTLICNVVLKRCALAPR